MLFLTAKKNTYFLGCHSFSLGIIEFSWGLAEMLISILVTPTEKTIIF